MHGRVTHRESETAMDTGHALCGIEREVLNLKEQVPWIQEKATAGGFTRKGAVGNKPGLIF